MKVILLNGPARSGKDTTKDLIADYANSLDTTKVLFVPGHEKFSAPIKLAFAGMMGAEVDDNYAVDGYEDDKEALIPILGVSYRQWQIDFSEKFMKPLYGKNIFAKLLRENITAPYLADDEGEWLFIVSDCGFQVEVDELVKHLKPEQVLLIRLHRQHTSYKGDSREDVYLPTSSWPHQHDVVNNGTLDQLCDHLIPILNNFGIKP